MSRVRGGLVTWLALSLGGCTAVSDFERFRLADSDTDGGQQDGGDPTDGQVPDSGPNPGDGGPGPNDGGDPGNDGGDADPGNEGPVMVAVTGEGRVTSEPAGIDCPDACDNTFAPGTMVTLTAVPGDLQQFAGWDGACSGTELTCQLTSGAAMDVGATFVPQQFDVSVMRGGTGAGVVTSADGAINCDGSAEEVCSAQFMAGSEVTLTGTSIDPDTFAGFGGDCGGTDPCVFTVTGDVNVTALFDAENFHSLLISRAGNGDGTVASTLVDGISDDSVDCGVVCGASFPAGSVVTLEATSAPNSQPPVWGGACAAAVGTTCDVTMDAVQNVTVTFSLTQHEVRIVWDGSASEGSVAFESPRTRDCTKPQDCAETFDYGTAVTVRASAADSSVFTGWNGCDGDDACEVTVTGFTALQPLFALKTYPVTTGAVSGAGSVLCDGSTCPTEATHGDELTFSAVPTPGSGMELVEWAGSCAGTAMDQDCVVTVDSAVNALASFALKQYTVTVDLVGDGTVQGDVPCAGGPCLQTFPHGSAVNLTASPGAGQLFAGWSGACDGFAACAVDPLLSDTQVTATFIVDSDSVVVSKSGSGTVVADSGAINCGPTCNDEYDIGTTVALTATPDTGYEFDGATDFSGCDTVNGNICQVMVTGGARNVDVTFRPERRSLTVNLDGAGTVVADPAGVSCPGTCVSDYPFDSTVVLTATADDSSTFEGWSGCDSVQGPLCTITIGTGANEVTADFDLKRFELSVTSVGGSTQEPNTVDRSPGGGACETPSDDCGQYDYGTDVTLTAQPGEGSEFLFWSLPSCPGTGPCVVDVTANTAVVANFGKVDRDLTVSVSGAGTVRSDEPSPQVECGSAGGSCTGTYQDGDTVVLTPDPDVGSTVFSWGPGPCQSFGSAPCSVNLLGNVSVSGSFRRAVTLEVELEGAGAWGADTLVSDGETINCGRTPGVNCVGSFLEGDRVVLRATPPVWAEEKVVWTDCPEADGNLCTIEMTDNLTVKARFVSLGALVFASSAVVNGAMEVLDDPRRPNGFPQLDKGKCTGAQGWEAAACYCRTLAARQYLDGDSFYPWLSDTDHAAIDSFRAATQCNAAVVLVTGDFITEGGGLRSMLSEGGGGIGGGDQVQLLAPISRDETGNGVEEYELTWTGTSVFSGGPTDVDEPFCDNWTSIDADRIRQGMGSMRAEDGAWTSQQELVQLGYACNRPARLYCIQDLPGLAICR